MIFSVVNTLADTLAPSFVIGSSFFYSHEDNNIISDEFEFRSDQITDCGCLRASLTCRQCSMSEMKSAAGAQRIANNAIEHRASSVAIALVT